MLTLFLHRALLAAFLTAARGHIKAVHFLKLFELVARHLGFEARLHPEPGVGQHFLGGGAVFRLPLQDFAHEIGEKVCFKLQHAILLYQDVLERPELQLLNVLEVAFLVKN